MSEGNVNPDMKMKMAKFTKSKNLIISVTHVCIIFARDYIGGVTCRSTNYFVLHSSTLTIHCTRV